MLKLMKSGVELQQDELVALTTNAGGQTVGELMKFLAAVDECDLTPEQKLLFNTAKALDDENSTDADPAPTPLKEAVKALFDALQAVNSGSVEEVGVSKANASTVNRLLADLKATITKVTTLSGGIKQDTSYNAQVIYTTKGVYLINGNVPIELFADEMKGSSKTLMFKSYKLVERVDEPSLTTLTLKSASGEEFIVRAYTVTNDRNQDTGMKSWVALYNLFNNVKKGDWVELNGSVVKDAIVPLIVEKNGVKLFANPARGVKIADMDKLSGLFYKAREQQFTPKVSRLVDDKSAEQYDKLLLETQANLARLESKKLNLDSEMEYKEELFAKYEKSKFAGKMSFSEFAQMMG